MPDWLKAVGLVLLTVIGGAALLVCGLHLVLLAALSGIN